MNISHSRESFFLENYIEDFSLGLGRGFKQIPGAPCFFWGGGVKNIWHPLFWEPCYGPVHISEIDVVTKAFFLPEYCNKSSMTQTIIQFSKLFQQVRPSEGIDIILAVH